MLLVNSYLYLKDAWSKHHIEYRIKADTMKTGIMLNKTNFKDSIEIKRIRSVDISRIQGGF